MLRQIQDILSHGTIQRIQEIPAPALIVDFFEPGKHYAKLFSATLSCESFHGLLAHLRGLRRRSFFNVYCVIGRARCIGWASSGASAVAWGLGKCDPTLGAHLFGKTPLARSCPSEEGLKHATHAWFAVDAQSSVQHLSIACLNQALE